MKQRRRVGLASMLDPPYNPKPLGGRVGLASTLDPPNNPKPLVGVSLNVDPQ